MHELFVLGHCDGVVHLSEAFPALLYSMRKTFSKGPLSRYGRVESKKARKDNG